VSSYQPSGNSWRMPCIQVVSSSAVATSATEGGPVPSTGWSTASGYVYVMRFEGDRIRHLTKVWNDVHVLRELGWA
jgi:hypothetical protein